MGHVARRDRVVTPHTHPDAHAIPTPGGGKMIRTFDRRDRAPSRVFILAKKEKSFQGG
jgi:hypothetical protein